MADRQQLHVGFWFLAVSGGMGLFIVQILVHMMGLSWWTWPPI